MRGSFEVAASSRAFALSAFLPSLSSTFFPPLRLAHRDSHGRPFRYSFVSWRLPSCPLTIPSRCFPSRSDPLEARPIFLLRTNLLALSSVSSFSSPSPALRGPTCGIVAALLRARFTTLSSLRGAARTSEGVSLALAPRRSSATFVLRTSHFFFILFNFPFIADRYEFWNRDELIFREF